MQITGGGNGLGRQIALKLAEKKCRLVIVDIDKEAAEETVSLVRDKEKNVDIKIYKANVSDFIQCQDLVNKVSEDFGAVDMLICNVGLIPVFDYVDITIDQIEKTVGVNVMSSLYLIKLVLNSMLERNSGHIICTSSIGGRIPLPGGSLYTLTKFGLCGFLDALRVELAMLGKNVKVTTLQPYFIKTNSDIRNFIEK